MKITDIKTEQGNDKYNSRFANDGGRYDQPIISVTFDDGVTVEIDDTSCGDFGSRIDYTMTISNGRKLCAHYGSMLPECERYTDFREGDEDDPTGTIENYLSEVKKETGYYPPVETIAETQLKKIKAAMNGLIIDYKIDRSALIDNGAVYYMNGNDGTDFDWQMNERLCEFYVFFDESEMGAVKILVGKDGTAEAFVFPNGEATGTKEDLGYLMTEEEAENLKEWLITNRDERGIWDAKI